MPRTVKLFRLFLAAPRDVVDEQRLVAEIVSEWNLQQGQSKGAIVELATWRTHAYPAVNDRGQAIVNRQVLASADLLVGIFWTRFGLPTGEAESGTEEEIRWSISNRKPVMVYFADRPVSPSTLDVEQYSKIQEFKKDFENQGLYWTYSASEEFAHAFRRHLSASLDEILDKEREERVATDEKDTPADGEATTGEEEQTEFISIPLSSKYWVLILGAMDSFVQQSIPKIDEIREKGISIDSLDPGVTTALVGPLIVRAIIIKELVAKGIMSKEAEEFGIDSFMAKVRKVLKQHEKKE